MLSKHYLTLYVRLASLLLGGGRGYVIALGRTSILAYIPEILARVLSLSKRCLVSLKKMVSGD
jgi:hypothetical protein